MNVTGWAKWLTIGAAVLGGVTQVVSTLEKPETAVSTAFAQSPDPDHYPVRLTAWLRSDRVTAGSTFPVELEITNGSAAAVPQIELEPLQNGAWSVTEWSDWDGTRRGQPLTPPKLPALASKETRKLQAQIRVHEGDNPVHIRFVYSYSQGEGLGRGSNVTDLGPVVAKGGRWLALFWAFVTGLIIPGLVAGIGWFIAHIAERTAHEYQTWNQLLEQHMKLTTDFYLPMCSAVLGMSRLVPKEPPYPADERQREVLYFLLLLMGRIRACRNQMGGLHFKNRLGEQVAGDWASSIKLLTQTAFPDVILRERVLDEMDLKESYAKFEDHFTHWSTRDDFARIQQQFERWFSGSNQTVPTFRDSLPVFEAFRAVVRFEANRPMESWYRAAEDDSDVRAAGQVVADEQFRNRPRMAVNVNLDAQKRTREYLVSLGPVKP